MQMSKPRALVMSLLGATTKYLLSSSRSLGPNCHRMVRVLERARTRCSISVRSSARAIGPWRERPFLAYGDEHALGRILGGERRTSRFVRPGGDE